MQVRLQISHMRNRQLDASNLSILNSKAVQILGDGFIPRI